MKKKNPIGDDIKEFFRNLMPFWESLDSKEDWYSQLQKPKDDDPLLSKWIIHSSQSGSSTKASKDIGSIQEDDCHITIFCVKRMHTGPCM